MSKVSIIVPIYNVEKYIEKCLQSLINQTFEDIEIWAVNDGTPDNSMEIVKKYAENDSRIKCIDKNNGGYGSVLEYAISKITTKYFLICDSDDWLEKDAIKILYESAEENNVDLVVGNKFLIYNDLNKKMQDVGYMSFYELENMRVYEKLENFAFFSVTPHSKLYKTEFAKDIKFPHKVSYTDTILYLLYLEKIKSAIYINNALSNYFIDRPGNTTGELEKLSQKAFDDMIIIINSIYEQLEKNERISEAIYYRLYLLVLFVIKKMDKNENKRLFKENKNKILGVLLKLQSHKKVMYKYINAENKLKIFIKRVLYNLIFSKLTNKLVVNILIYIRLD